MIDILEGPGTFQQKFPAKHRQFMRHDIDVSKEPMLVYPTLHYQNGGISINPRCETEVENLYVAGEASGGLHGRNRLMGNSLLDIVVYGRVAGRNAAEKSKSAELGKPSLAHVEKYNQALDKEGIKSELQSPILLPDYAGKIG
jgi:succinate dehydrogenase / fumarate reductase flavoprotein subunit